MSDDLTPRPFSVVVKACEAVTFSLTVRPGSPQARVALSGALDTGAADHLRTGLFGHMLDCPVLVVDLADVSALDRRAAGVLALVAHVAERTGHQIRWAAPSPSVRARWAGLGSDTGMRVFESVFAAETA
ncbi:STAS domain-containing protein [Actinocatenispora rupis]|uniref:STAS domain-containing protein n=1 Tax=Actinocatenispora rupis TaxID=519421 RepID=A0A8J3J4X5_9ACTN|nr:STAS domain-containing protein [Actinocatenispora rupis]GID10239.1 hypothetical protein Aru02nite_11280 [Actinocatenispora rupis]